MLGIPKGLPIESWRDLGRQIYLVTNSSAWWLGDWLLYGEVEYPNRYKDAIKATSLDYQTLRNYAWVARRFPPERRRQRLSFQHHAEVASLPEADQESWLTQAELGRWSRNELRRRIRETRRIARGEAEEVHLKVNLDGSQKQRWQDAAERAEQDLLTWMVSILDRAASSRQEPDGV
ncbi:LmbU family transcriptional regulator [Prauserella sp. ASG 168]|uniref:LmbU family transcriptional regulator n=2 Tax=Prauserella cavernicola TaxID=2800127 RepID=A0A934QXA2_9PSEU|nr:LmbU family transcriptional regulator [Prauserella cavernicola]